MTRRVVYPLFILLTLSSCKRERKDMLVNVWQEVSTQNPQFEEVMKSQQQFIDTIGSHTTPEQNLATYGVTNIDSFKQSLQANMDSFKKMQERSIAQTQFDFRKNGIVYIHTDLGVDSATWKLEEDGTTLLLDEERLTGTGTQLQMEITELTERSLKLRFSDKNSYSSANFVPAKK